MRKEFERLKAVLFGGAIVGESLAEVSDLIDELENKIDEVEKRIDCAVRNAKEAINAICKYTEDIDSQVLIRMHINDHDSIFNGSNDVKIALDMGDTECIENDWYGLFKPKEEPSPIAVGKVEYEFPEEVYTIGNANNTEIIGDVYESDFIKLLDLGMLICESDSAFPNGGNKANYVVRKNEFIIVIKNRQIDLSKVPIKREVFMTFESSWGEIVCDEEGNVLEVGAEKEINGEHNYLFDIVKFDIAEYLTFLGSRGIESCGCDDILNVSYWNKDNTYTEADKDWRGQMFDKVEDKAPTALCNDKYKNDVVVSVIAKLKEIEVDGETMQHIIEQLGMNDQMLRQLVLTNPYVDTADLLKEKEENPLH